MLRTAALTFLLDLASMLSRLEKQHHGYSICLICRRSVIVDRKTKKKQKKKRNVREKGHLTAVHS